MGVDMTDFKLSFRGQRRRSGARGSKSPLDEMAEQIRDLDEAAQRASRRINQSARKLRASHKWHPESGDDALAELATSLVARADAIRADCDQLSALLERAKQVVGAPVAKPNEGQRSREVAPPIEADWDAARAALDGVPGEVAASLLEDDLGEPHEGSVWQGPTNGRLAENPASEGVRLIATQMAIAGSTRVEIHDRLREQFGIDEANPVLDEIFGESPEVK